MKVINKYPNYTIPAKPITTSTYTPSYYYNDSDYWFGTKKPIKKEPLPTTRWYFAYGSNMSRKRISSRGVFWKHSITGVLPDYELNFNKKAGVTGLCTVTIYSFSCWFRARRILLTISPSLVKKMSPSLALSKRPIGKIRVG